jgi:proliferating cell nuclear antigen PCNA
VNIEINKKTNKHNSLYLNIMNFEITDKNRCLEFINIFKNLNNLTDSINIVVNSDRFYIQGMDQSHICVYELFLDKSWFHTWNVSSDKTYGFQLSMFNKILHTYSDTQMINLQADDESDKMKINFTSKSDFNKFFELPLMDIDCEMLNIPECDYEVDIIMNAKKFKSLIDELTQFSDTVLISCNEGQFSVNADGDAATMKVVVDMDDIENYSVIENETIDASFGLKYLAQMCQFYKLSSNCTIHISRNMPIQIKYEIDEDSMMRFYLAPKIDD